MDCYHHFKNNTSFFLPIIIFSLLILLLLKYPEKWKFSVVRCRHFLWVSLVFFSPWFHPFSCFHRVKCMCSVCVCVYVIYFSDLRVGLVNTWCFRIILKLRSVWLLPQMLHHGSLLLTFRYLSKQGEPCNVPRNTRCVGVESYMTLLSCVHVDIKCVCQCVCVCFCACVHVVSLFNFIICHGVWITSGF